MNRRIISGCSKRIGVTFAVFLILGTQVVLAQREIRYPKYLQHAGKEFAAYVDEITGVPTWIIDTDSLDFMPGTSTYLFSESDVRAAADAFLDAHKKVLGMDLKQLGDPLITSDADWWYISYPQIHNGFRVIGAGVGVTVTRHGRLVAVGVTGFPKLDVNTSYSLDLTAAIAAVRGRISVPNLEEEAKEDLVIMATNVNGRYVFHPAWEIVLYNYDHDPPFSKTFLVDAHSGKTLREYSNILGGGGLLTFETGTAADQSIREKDMFSPAVHYSSVLNVPQNSDASLWQMNQALPECSYSSEMAHSLSGTITLNYYDSPNHPTAALFRNLNQPFKGARFRVREIDGSFDCIGYANDLGMYRLSLNRSGDYQVRFDIANDVVPASSSDSILITGQNGQDQPEVSKLDTIRVSGPTELNYNWGWGSSGDGGLTSFALNAVYQIRRMHDYFVNTHQDPGVKIDGLFIGMPRTGGYYPLSNEITLGGAYAMSSDIALHEYTHATLRLTRSSGMQYAMSEGFADFFPTDVTGDNMYGGPDTSNSDPSETMGNSSATIRYLYNWCTEDDFYVVDFPCGQVGSLSGNLNWHNTGKIISGVLWRMRQSIGAEAAVLLYSALKLPSEIPGDNMGYAYSTFQDLRTRYEAVDKVRNQGRNARLIESKFAVRKIGGPRMPSSFNIQEGSNQNAIISWRDESWIEDGYVVESKNVSGSWSVIARLDSDSTQFTDTRTGCIANKPIARDYRVAAYKAYGSSDGSYEYRTSPDTLWTYSPDKNFRFSPDTCGGTIAGKTPKAVQIENNGALLDSTLFFGGFSFLSGLGVRIRMNKYVLE